MCIKATTDPPDLFRGFFYLVATLLLAVFVFMVALLLDAWVEAFLGRESNSFHMAAGLLIGTVVATFLGIKLFELADPSQRRPTAADRYFPIRRVARRTNALSAWHWASLPP